MINQLPELEEEDTRYNLHIGSDKPYTYNLTLVFPKNTSITTPLNSPLEIKNALVKLGILF